MRSLGIKFIRRLACGIVLVSDVKGGEASWTHRGGRTMHTRGIRAIRENARLNTGLWQLALRRIGQ